MMKYSIFETFRSLARLLKFVLCYSLAVYALFYALPWAAVLLQAKYDALPVGTRFAIVAVMLVPVIAGLVAAIRSRHLVSSLSGLDHQTDS